MRAVLALGAIFSLVLCTGCGGEGEEQPTSTASGMAPLESSGGGTRRGPARVETDGDGPTRAAAKGSSGRPQTGAEAAVDLTVDPARVEGAVVTESGAVQTLPPSPKAHRTAQENSYASLRTFGVEAEGAEATNITFALVQYLTAKAEGDWIVACARLYSVLRANLEKLNGSGEAAGSCPEAYGALMSRVSQSARAEQARIDVFSVRRGEGNRAFVLYKTPDTLSADMPMYVEAGVWKVGAIDAYALTPEQER